MGQESGANDGTSHESVANAFIAGAIEYIRVSATFRRELIEIVKH